MQRHLIDSFAPDVSLADFSEWLQEDIEVGELLGVGGFGEVFGGCLREGRAFALKTLQERHCYQDFVHELQLTSRFQHPCVIGFLGYVVRPKLGILLEFASHGDLYAYVFDRYQLSKAVNTFYGTVGAAALSCAPGLDGPSSSEGPAFETRFALQLQQIRSAQSRLPDGLASLGDLVDKLVAACQTFFHNPNAENDRLRESANGDFVAKYSVCHPRVPLPLFFRLAMDIAAAIQYLHKLAAPVVHLDIKLLNVLLAGDPQLATAQRPCVRLADFGSSREFRVSNPADPEALATAVPPLALNPRWSAPETFGNSFCLFSDVFSFASLMLEILTMQLSFSGREGPFAESKIQKLLLDGQRSAIPSHIPADLARLIRSCWHQQPCHRPTISQVISQLSQIASHLNIKLE